MIQIFRADFGPQSADRSSDEPPESESDEGWRETERRLTAGQECNMGQWSAGTDEDQYVPLCVCVCLFMHDRVSDYTCD